MDDPSRWRAPSPLDVPALTELLAATDRDWDNVVERSEDDVRALVAGARGVVRWADAGPDAVALAVPGEEVLVRVRKDLPDRTRALADAYDAVAAELAAGTPLWLPAADEDAARCARERGMAAAYTDLQMRTPVPVPPAPPVALPAAYAWRELEGLDATVGDEVHDLVCAAWGVDPHREAFRARFEDRDADPTLWVLVDRDEPSASPLAAAALGQVHRLADGRFGVVAHLDVHPRDRRRGLGTAALQELLRRFALLGLEQAQLGVHDDNASQAPELYRSLGWQVVSAQARWVRSR